MNEQVKNVFARVDDMNLGYVGRDANGALCRFINLPAWGDSEWSGRTGYYMDPRSHPDIEPAQIRSATVAGKLFSMDYIVRVSSRDVIVFEECPKLRYTAMEGRMWDFGRDSMLRWVKPGEIVVVDDVIRKSMHFADSDRSEIPYYVHYLACDEGGEVYGYSQPPVLGYTYSGPRAVLLFEENEISTLKINAVYSREEATK